MEKADILSYLNKLRKPESEDPMHKWIGSYNGRQMIFNKFFRWLYSPDEQDIKKRVTPPCMNGVKQLPRKEKSPYKPSDLWKDEEHAIFLKYCLLKRDRCYHAMANDTSARPHELLKLKIRDIQFKQSPDGVQYAEILVSGKTKPRTLPLINSIPHLKEWIQEHPVSDNQDAPLFISMSDKSKGLPLARDALLKQYRDHYQAVYFPRLLGDPTVPFKDKDVIRAMLRKPWNLYIFRHSALTQKSQILKESTLRDHAGWTMTSKMPAVHIHFFGTESSKSLLEAAGIIKRNEKQTESLRPKTCPHCSEPNKPDSKFCLRCKMVMSYDAYTETVSEAEKTRKDVAELKENYQKLMAKMKEYADNEEKLSEARDRVMVLKAIEAIQRKSSLDVQAHLLEQVQGVVGAEKTHRIIEELRTKAACSEPGDKK